MFHEVKPYPTSLYTSVSYNYLILIINSLLGHCLDNNFYMFYINVLALSLQEM